ncbi:RRQRL motif-containing zinc-binding protein [Nocardia sp. CNY236]|uniref:RRQRL motif-containing zinc-binding protein n=1 Tax=Nocardia sp. CNY236 TaxID=1169152 RepID=UPI00068787CC|nr:RRQRL motif-containing zinc-binding protein [Nocardia sp. CNY236]
MSRNEPRVEGGIPVYAWRFAPSHLRTRRQLAKEGLRPNGQDIAGKVQRRRRGGREPLTAYLYDIALAAPKRPATPAQLAALAKATRERQMRAAERHGVDRSEFEVDRSQTEDQEPQRTTPISALADYRPDSSLADAFSWGADWEGVDR